MHLAGIPVWKKFEGWQEPNTVTGIIYLTIAFGIYKAVNYFCKTPATLKCTSCKKVFDELLTKDNKCPDCKSKLIDVNEYYKEPNKNEETNNLP